MSYFSISSNKKWNETDNPNMNSRNSKSMNLTSLMNLKSMNLTNSNLNYIDDMMKMRMKMSLNYIDYMMKMNSSDTIYRNRDDGSTGNNRLD